MYCEIARKPPVQISIPPAKQWIRSYSLENEWKSRRERDASAHLRLKMSETQEGKAMDPLMFARKRMKIKKGTSGSRRQWTEKRPIPYLKFACFIIFFVQNMSYKVLKMITCKNWSSCIVWRVCIGGFLAVPLEVGGTLSVDLENGKVEIRFRLPTR